MTDLVIFDCDGVLVDSEIIACRVEAEELAKLGIRYPPEEIIRQFSGVSERDMQKILETRHEMKLPSTYLANVRQRIDHLLETSLIAIAGVEKVLIDFPYRKCVASSSAPERLTIALSHTGLIQYFGEDIFSSAMVERGKPAPDIFLFAAGKMNAEPDSCVVVEDSVIGVTAAKAAGMFTIGFVGASHCLDGHGDELLHAGADFVIENMNELIGSINAAA